MSADQTFPNRLEHLHSSSGIPSSDGDGEQLWIAGVDLAALIGAAGRLDVVVRKCVALAVKVDRVHDARVVVGDGVLVVQVLGGGEGVGHEQGGAVEGGRDARDDGVPLRVGARGERARRAREDVARRRAREAVATVTTLTKRECLRRRGYLGRHGAEARLRVDGQRLRGELGPRPRHVVVKVRREQVRVRHHPLVG